MMAMSNFCPHLSSLLFFFSLINFPFITISETPCPYPCYPPPIAGGGGSTPRTGYYPQPTGYYPPPAGYYPPPISGNVPNNYYPTPPYVGGNFGGGGGGYYGPPPPDAILPYFPYYFKKPPHQTDQSSSSSSSVSAKSTVKIVTVANLVAVLVFLGNVLLTISM